MANMARNARFVLYVIVALAITNGATFIAAQLGATSAQGAGYGVGAIMILVVAPRVRMSSWWALAALIPIVVWYPIIRGSWRLARLHSGEVTDFEAGSN